MPAKRRCLPGAFSEVCRDGARSDPRLDRPSPRRLPSSLTSSASFDGSVRIWDPTVSKARLVLSSHSSVIYSVAFSPSGEFVASTAADRVVAIHSTADGSLVRSYLGPGAGYDLEWAPEGNRLAACFSTGGVSVIDMRR